jgi:hypothetical protein
MAAVRFCEICKGEINAERAAHAPETRLCMEHARAVEEFGGEFITIGPHERTSKQGSLKQNYGGVTTTRMRNVQAVERLRRSPRRVEPAAASSPCRHRRRCRGRRLNRHGARR